MSVKGIKISDWQKLSGYEQKALLDAWMSQIENPTIESLQGNLSAIKNRIDYLCLAYQMSADDIKSFLEGGSIFHLRATADIDTLNRLRKDKESIQERIKALALSND